MYTMLKDSEAIKKEEVKKYSILVISFTEWNLHWDWDWTIAELLLLCWVSVVVCDQFSISTNMIFRGFIATGRYF